MIRVLFVCLGNICRSPMAEAVFAHKVRQAGLQDQFEVDSAGTGQWHIGQAAHANTRALLEANDIACDHCARQLTQTDLDTFDYLVTMDEMNQRDVAALGKGRAQVMRLMDYAPHTGVREVPDPYLVGGFDKVYALIDQATDGLLAALQRDHQG